MKKSKFTESQIIKALKENEQGTDRRGHLPRDGNRQEYLLLLAQEVRRHGDCPYETAEGTRGGEPQAQADVRRRKPGRTHAQGRTVKKVLGPSDKKHRAKYLQGAYPVSASRSCDVIGLARSMWYYHTGLTTKKRTIS